MKIIVFQDVHLIADKIVAVGRVHSLINNAYGVRYGFTVYCVGQELEFPAISHWMDRSDTIRTQEEMIEEAEKVRSDLLDLIKSA